MSVEKRPFGRTQLFASILEAATKWWSIIVPLVGGAVSGYLAYLTSALAAYAPWSWFAAGLAAAMMLVLIGLCASKTAELVARWNYTRKITASTPTFNPLDSVFTKKQIKLSELRNPFNPVHENKNFLDCEIIGPGVLYFDGSTTLTGIGFVNCDCVAIREGAAINNLMVFKDAVIRGGKIYGVTLLFPAAAKEHLNAQLPGIPWIT